MPLTASSQFAQTVENNVERTVAARVTMALPAGTYSNFSWSVKAIQLDGNVNTDLPDGVRDKDGVSTVGGTLTLAGMLIPTSGVLDETKTAWWLFNPDNPASPLYRTDIRDSVIVTIDIGEGTTTPTGQQAIEYVRKLTGTITSYRVGHLDGTVEFDVVDTPPDWGNVPATPGVVTAPPYNAGLTNEFPMDQIIRSMQGVSSWPAQRPQCVLAAGLRSSFTPERGQLGQNPNAGNPTFAPGWFGSALASNSAPYILDSPVGDDVFIEFGAFAPGGATGIVFVQIGSAAGLVELGVLSNGDVRVRVGSTSFGSPDVFTVTGGVPVDGASHYVALKAHWASGSTSWSGSVRVDGTDYPTGTRTTQARGGTLTAGQIYNGAAGGLICAVQATTETAPAYNNTFTPKFICDPSLNRLVTVPAIDKGTLAWDELQTIAASELGFIRRGADGVIRFTNRNNLRTAPIGRTVASRVSLLSLNTSVPPKVIYNRFQVGYTDWNFKTNTTVYDASANNSIIKVPARKPFQFVRYLADGILAASVDTGISVLPDGQNPANGQSWYRVSLDRYGNGEHPGLKNVTVTVIAPNAVRISGSNATSQDAYFVSSAAHGDLNVGSAALWIGGTTATASDEITVETVFSAGDKLLALDSNAYRQYPEEAASVGQFLGAQLTVASRDFTDVAVVPDVRIDASDKVHLQWPEKAVDDYVTVWGWSLSLDFPTAGQSGGSFAETLDVTPLGPPGAWLGGIAGRSEGGITTYGY